MNINAISGIKPISYKSNEVKEEIKEKQEPVQAPIQEAEKEAVVELEKIEEKKETAQELEKIKRNDMYAKMPIRLLGYANEFGEALRPVSPVVANLSWLPAIGYIGADIADKYKQDEYAEHTPSKRRALKQFSTQLFASVLLPTVAVKIGQHIANATGVLTSTKLSFNERENISNLVLDSMNSGEHKKHLAIDGSIETTLFKNSIYGKFVEQKRHKNTHKKMMEPLYAALDFIKKPFARYNIDEKIIQDYTQEVVNRISKNRLALLQGKKPKTMSEKAFKRFQKATIDTSTIEKQSIVYDSIRNLEKKKMFKNKIIKTIGGFTALAVMAKPIDNFVENVIVDKYVGPQIDNVTELYIKHRNTIREAKLDKTPQENSTVINTTTVE